MHTVFLMLYVCSFNELEQLHMEVLLNCHLANFCTIYLNYKKWANENLITLACVIALVYYS